MHILHNNFFELEIKLMYQNGNHFIFIVETTQLVLVWC